MADTHPLGNSPAPLAALHVRRIRLMLWLGSALLIMMGFCWAIYFAWQREWFIVALDAS